MRLIRLLFCGVLTLLLSNIAPASLSPVRGETSSAAPAAVPANFVDESYVSGLLSPRTFAWTPDGRLLIVERGSSSSIDSNLASIRIFQNGALLPDRAYTREVCGGGERGFLGLAVDRNFATNGFLYIYYSALADGLDKPCDFNTYVANKPGPRNTISRLTMAGNTIDPASEVVLINNIATDTGVHNAGDLVMDADGYLYASVGDSNISPNNPAQDRSSLNGKILRIKPQANGTYTTEGNPYDADPNAFSCGTTRPSNTSVRCKEIFAYGFRNPFRFTLKPNSNSLFVADVGGSSWEEISDISNGNNAGFNVREGPCAGGVICPQPAPPSGYVDPVYSYPHEQVTAKNDAAVIGGAFYTGTRGSTPWPADYVGNYFFADNVRGLIRRLKLNATTQIWEAVTPEFSPAGTGRGIIGLRAGPDGNLYYLTYKSDENRTSEIRRIRYQSSGNVAPEAQASVSPSNGSVGTPFVFSAAGSVDPDSSVPLQYRWDFGDGSPLQTTSSITLAHQYNAGGTFTATLVAIDMGTPALTSLPASVNVFVNNTPPTATLVLTNTTQLNRALFHGDDVWQYAAVNAIDDTPLPSDAYLWSVVFHHRDHTHPFLSNMSGPSGDFTIPSTGEVDPIVWYRVTLSLKDSAGQVATIIRDVYPETATLSLQTNPPGGIINVDGVDYTTPAEITRVVGLHGALNAPSPQNINGRSYTFQSWAHGGAQLQPIIAPAGGTIYLANFADVGAAPAPIATLPPPANPALNHHFYMPIFASP